MNSGTRTTPNHPGLTLPKFARNKAAIPVAEAPPPLVIPTPKRTPAVAIVNGVIPDIANLPRTPLYIPKIGIAKGAPPTPSQILQPDENPWLPPKVEGADEVKIAALTPIGTIALVPTCDKRLPPTPRKLPPTPVRHLTLKVLDENTGTARIDPILTAAIYLDCTKPEDQNYNHVAERMRKITANTISLQKQYITTFRPLPQIVGRVTPTVFEDALAVYENNQVYYQDRIDDKTMSRDDIRAALTSLEQWFACIIEPRPREDADAWRERELSKLTKGVTSYCDPDLYPYITPMPPQIIATIKQHHMGVL